jgi:hypothetical protein
MHIRGLSNLLFLGAASLLVIPANAQNCRASVGGSYSFSSFGNGAAGSLMNTSNTGTGTGNPTTTTPTYSETEVGRLLSGVAGNKPFAASGTLNLDNGVITANSASLGLMNQQVGTYTVNSDCTITVMLTDAFGTGTSASTRTTLQGVILRNGGEIVLGTFRNAPTTTTDTSGTPTTTTPVMSTSGQLIQSNILVTLTRTLSSTCNAASLNGAYGLVISGTGLSNVNTTDTDTTNDVAQVMPFFVVATVQFDGSGGVTSSSNLPSSPLSFLRYSGSYTVSSNCTGTMTLRGVAPASTTTGTGTGTGTTTTPATTTAAMTFNFVLVKPQAEVNAAGQAPGAGQTRPGIKIISSSTNQTFMGEGWSID